MDPSQFITSAEIPVCNLDCAESFKKLTEKEKLYAHHMSRASWAGSQIVLMQTSPEAPSIFKLFLQLFAVSDLKARALGAG